MNEKTETIRERLIPLLGIEPLISLTLLAVGVYIFYKIFLKGLGEERHANLKRLFNELSFTHMTFIVLWILQFVTLNALPLFDPFYTYFGIGAVIFGALSFVRSIKILVNEYLFLNSMSAGVPILLVNIVTLIISIFIAAWLSTSVFGVRWAPLLATSAIVSVVLGLALQETLGNLFAGVALQFDKPYEIGDWIELFIASGEKVAGEVHEITWRATILNGLFDEVITLPNRLVAQSEVANFSARRKPIYRGLNVVLDANADEAQVKAILTKVLSETNGVIQSIPHYIMLRDLTEKGALWRLFYPIVHYSKQFIIVDEILVRSQTEFKRAGISITTLKVTVETATPAPTQR